MFEKVNMGHPDKIADRIAGFIVDLAYKECENPKVAVEVLIGHDMCKIITESNILFSEDKYAEEIYKAVNRIVGYDGVEKNCRVEIISVKQDPHLAENQSKEIRCGDNGIFKGVPVSLEEKQLTDIAKIIYDKYPYDGKYILDLKQSKLIICQSNCDDDKLRELVKQYATYKDVVINPIGSWVGGIDSDTGACVDGNALISTDKGLKRMSDISVDDNVLTDTGSYERVVCVMPKGVKKTYTLRDKRGHFINVTDDHRFAVLENGDIVYKYAKDLVKDDLLVRLNKSSKCSELHNNLLTSNILTRKEDREFGFDEHREFPSYIIAPLLNLDNSLIWRYALEKYCDLSAINTNRMVSYQKLTYFLDLYGRYFNTDEYKKCEWLLNFDFVRFDSLIENDNIEVFDIEVENRNCFVANGFLVHNCNRKLGSDMSRGVTGGGLCGKDLSKADVSVNIMCHLLAQENQCEVSAFCAIGDKSIVFNFENGKKLEMSYKDVTNKAKQYIDSIGGFEKFAEWGLIR